MHWVSGSVHSIIEWISPFRRWKIDSIGEHSYSIWTRGQIGRNCGKKRNAFDTKRNLQEVELEWIPVQRTFSRHTWSRSIRCLVKNYLFYIKSVVCNRRFFIKCFTTLFQTSYSVNSDGLCTISYGALSVETTAYLKLNRWMKFTNVFIRQSKHPSLLSPVLKLAKMLLSLKSHWRWLHCVNVALMFT